MDQASFDKVFSLPFKEAEAFFRDKLNIPTTAWNEMAGAAHAKGFMSAGAYNADLLHELRGMTDKAIAGGMDIREFRKQFAPLVERYGWQLKGGGPAWRSDLIWRTNINTANQAGRWQQFEAAGIKYLLYMHNDSVRYPRPTHKAMNGLILPRTDPFWSVNYPPNGWGCKCRAVAARDKEYNDAPKEMTKRPKDWQHMADAGWDYNVGQAAGTERGYRALTDKFESLPNDIAREWMGRFVNEPAFSRFFEGEIQGDFPVAVLRPEDMGALNTEKQTLWLSDDSLKKNKGATARSKGHPELTLADYRMIPEIVDTGEVYRQGEERLVYLMRGEDIYRVAIKKTKDGESLYFLTLFKTSEIKAEREIIAKLERIR